MFALFLLTMALVGMVSAADDSGSQNADDDNDSGTGDDNKSGQNQDQSQDNSDDNDDDEDGADDSSTGDDSNLTRAELKRARDEAAKYRVERNSLRNEFDTFKKNMAKALGMGDSDEPDPDAVSRELEQTRNELRQERMRNAFNRVADKLEADSKLSWSHLYASGELNNIDDDNMESSIESVLKTALEDEPKLKRNYIPARSGSDDSNGRTSEVISMNDLIRGSRQ